MRAAPAAAFPVARSGFWWAVAISLLSLSLAVLVWLIGRFFDPEGRVVSVPAGVLPTLALLLVVSVGGYRAIVRRLSPRELRWDGQVWSLRIQGLEHLQPELGWSQCMLDWGGHLLLRWHPLVGHYPMRWLPMSRRDAPAHWHALRCALWGARPLAQEPAL